MESGETCFVTKWFAESTEEETPNYSPIYS